MADVNYKLIEEKNDSMWFEGSPVILCAMRLELNTSNSKLYTSAKFMNIQPDNLRNISLEIICYNENREPIDRIKGVAFTGLDVDRHTDFGYNRRIPVENINTRSVEYIVVSVTNVFNQTWENEGLKPFDQKIEQKNIYEVQGDYNRQFLEICTRSGIDGTMLVFEPEFSKSHWLCACGGFNWNDERVCTLCGVGRSWLEKNTSMEALEKQKEFQMTEAIRIKEQIQSKVMHADDKSAMKEEFENRTREFKKQQKKQKTKKRVRTSFIVALILAIIAGLVYAAIAFGIPYMKYSTAISYMQQENYDAAIEKFTDLGDFMDSKEYKMQSVYGKAVELSKKKQYKEAAELFKEISGYSDSKERYSYNIGIQQFEDRDYIGASETFKSIEDYKDSKEKYEECLAALFKEAESNMKGEKYEAAYEKFKFLAGIGYKDSGEKINECLEAYLKNAESTLKDGKYESAYNKFKFLADLGYKNSAERMKECKYKIADNDYTVLRYSRAFRGYNEIKGYKDVDSILEKNDTLFKLISSATDQTDARWETGKMTCPYCKNEDASYYIVFTGFGKMFFGLDCPDADKYGEQGKEERYLYKIEGNILYQMDYDGKTNWNKFADIISLESDGSKYKLVLRFAGSGLVSSGEEMEFSGTVTDN